MKPLVYRQNRLFKLEVSELPLKARSIPVQNALYAAIYDEFLDAQINPKYLNTDLVQRIQAVNDFARQWLIDKGFV
jgi:hypothetical protein